MVPENISEVERIKLLLLKSNEDQQSYFFSNIENIFQLSKGHFHNVYGSADSGLTSKDKFNYDT